MEYVFFNYKQIILIMFKNKTLLITGGTGSFGNAVLKRFLNSSVKEIRIFSRDEKKQDDMRHELQNNKVKFYITSRIFHCQPFGNMHFPLCL